MTHTIIMAGFGGQGIMTAGKILAKAALKEGKNVAWLPSYGPEMRGGTANCSITISDKEIGNPFVTEATALLAFNRPSLEKFKSDILPEGILVSNSSLTGDSIPENGVKAFNIPANEIASQLGNIGIVNMVMLGAYIKVSDIVEMQTALEVIAEWIGGKRPEIMALNREAISQGSMYI